MTIITLIYLADIVKGLSIVCALAGIFLLVCLLIRIIAYIDLNRGSLKNIVITGGAALLSLFLAVLIPSKDAIYLMASVTLGKEVVEQPQVKELGSKVLTILNQKLDEMAKK